MPSALRSIARHDTESSRSTHSHVENIQINRLLCRWPRLPANDSFKTSQSSAGPAVSSLSRSAPASVEFHEAGKRASARRLFAYHSRAVRPRERVRYNRRSNRFRLMADRIILSREEAFTIVAPPDSLKRDSSSDELAQRVSRAFVRAVRAGARVDETGRVPRAASGRSFAGVLLGGSYRSP